MITWHKGPPPEIGWWPASGVKDRTVLRWWDGECWSHPAFQHDTASMAAQVATHKTGARLDEIEWTERWWEKK